MYNDFRVNIQTTPLYVHTVKNKVHLWEFKRKKKKKKIVLIPVKKISVFDIEKFFRILNKPVTIGIPLKILSANFIEKLSRGVRRNLSIQVRRMQGCLPCMRPRVTIVPRVRIMYILYVETRLNRASSP